MKNSSSLLKKPEMPIVLSIVEGCAQSTRSNVPATYAAARRFLARLASEIFLSSSHINVANILAERDQ
jgi:hypothetical protein